MKRADMVKQLREMGVRDAELALTGVLTLWERALKAGEPIVLHRFGRFEAQRVKESYRRNPSGGEDFIIPEHTTVRFRPGPKLKARLNAE